MKYTKLQRTAALAAVILLVLMFAATLIVGLFGGPDSKGLLKALIFSDFVIPTAMYGYMLILRHRKAREQEREKEQKQAQDQEKN
ncbi:MAG: hypothetical protein IJT43_11180 [Stomatobaculum sp.]|nr:hypothetical protein [Stomatobaculum sp.]